MAESDQNLLTSESGLPQYSEQLEHQISQDVQVLFKDGATVDVFPGPPHVSTISSISEVIGFQSSFVWLPIVEPAQTSFFSSAEIQTIQIKLSSCWQESELYEMRRPHTIMRSRMKSACT